MNMLTIYTEIIIGCWAAFILYWFFSAFKAKRTISKPAVGTGLLIRVGIGAVIIISAHFLLPILPAYAFEQPSLINSFWGIFGSMFTALGVAIAIWARYYLGSNWGMPMSVKEKPELVTGGPYSFVRHPIYSGILLAMLGSAMVTGLWWLAVLLGGIVYFIYSSKKEEGLMMKEFPDTFPAYKARTWALIPFIY